MALLIKERVETSAVPPKASKKRGRSSAAGGSVARGWVFRQISLQGVRGSPLAAGQ